MWVIPKNHALYSAFAQDMLESKEDLALLESTIEHSLTLKSKLSPLQTWYRRWSRINWLPHLFGRMLKPSLHTSFEEKLTYSMQAIHANPLVWQAKIKEKNITKTQDTSGLTSETTSKQSDLFDAFSRMSKDTSTEGLEKSLEIWKNWVTQQRGDYSARKKLALLIRGKESLSWATPNTMDHLPQRSKEGLKHQTSVTRKGRSRPGNLREQINPEAMEAYETEKCPIDDLESIPPMRSMYAHKQWPTPTADAMNSRNKQYKQGGTSLATAVKLPTPTARDYKDCGANTNYEKARQKKRLPGFVEGRLSPEWVESLMGLPVGWTKLQNDRCDSRGWKEEASWLDGSWEKDIPRVAESQEHCTNRLILLGNGVVPSTAAKAWTVLDKRFKGD